MAFVLRAELVIRPVILGVYIVLYIVLDIVLYIVLYYLFNLCSFCIVISLLDQHNRVKYQFVTFFSRPFFSAAYCALVANLLVLDILVSIALTLVNNLLHTVFLIKAICTTLLTLCSSGRTVTILSKSNSFNFVLVYLNLFLMPH